jgi:hypothetical protein
VITDNSYTDKSYYESDSMLDVIQKQAFDKASFYLDYLFWDTSDEFIGRYGMPLDVHVLNWIDIISKRVDITDVEKQQLINQCNEYIGVK